MSSVSMSPSIRICCRSTADGVAADGLMETQKLEVAATMHGV